eukprot:GHVS01056396.1.p1 GENE.GHVS01056396.1~~GHVS01056396.1.p1  ORF type:complete len:310 (-),score=87.44 GHVS01056396.1:251-1057(-)
MGYICTWRFVNRGVRRRVFRRFHRSPDHRWDMLKNMLDSLLRHGRVETTLAKAKEVQQYAEEIVHFAKKDAADADKIVESMLRTPQARKKLYEVLVPRYRDRHFYVTRVFNQWRIRLRDATPMAFVEFVDRPGELRPANPVGFQRVEFVWQQMQQNRRLFRRYLAEARMRRLVDEQGKLLTCIDHLKPTEHLWQEREEVREYEPLGSSAEQQEEEKEWTKFGRKFAGGKMTTNEGGMVGRGMDPFYVHYPFGHQRQLADNRLRKIYQR